MREILFRGKSLDDGDWRYGGYAESTTGRVCIAGFSKRGRVGGCEVDPETVGQFTGMTDKTGKRIFEGDIIKAIASNHVGEDIQATVIVSLDDYELMWDIEHSHEIEVIGNIFDNPELMKGGGSDE